MTVTTTTTTAVTITIWKKSIENGDYEKSQVWKGGNKTEKSVGEPLYGIATTRMTTTAAKTGILVS